MLVIPVRRKAGDVPLPCAACCLSAVVLATASCLCRAWGAASPRRRLDLFAVAEIVKPFLDARQVGGCCADCIADSGAAGFEWR